MTASLPARAASRPLLVCHDLQRAYVSGGPLSAQRAGEALLQARRLLTAARAHNWSIAHCLARRAESALPIDGEEARPIEGFEPLAREMVLERSSLSAYGHPAFHGVIEAGHGAGVLCVSLGASLTLLATCFDAFERGHRLVLAGDAVAAGAGLHASAREHRAVAFDVAAMLGLEVLDGGASSIEEGAQPLLSAFAKRRAP